MGCEKRRIVRNWGLVIFALAAPLLICSMIRFLSAKKRQALA